MSRAIGYVSIGVAQAVMVVSLSLWNNLNTNRASLMLHRDCVQNLMHAPISWFEKNPSGRWLAFVTSYPPFACLPYSHAH